MVTSTNASVDIVADEAFRIDPETLINTMIANVHNAPGRDFFRTFCKKFPSMRALFGSNVRKNAGKPMVIKLSRVSWNGVKG